MAHGMLKGATRGVLGVVVLLAGCAGNKSGQAQVARQTVTSMHDLRHDLVEAREQIEDTVAAMDRLASAPADRLAWASGAFNKQVFKTVTQAGTVRRQSDQMCERWRNYLVRWEQGNEELSTPELQAGAAERRAAAQKNYERLRDAARTVDQAYPPFLGHLRDIRIALSLDLTRAGVQAAQPAFEGARASAADLRREIANLIIQIGEVEAVSPPRT